ncbi:MAG: CvpA family protein [Cyclonatronaceae bacterium]
MNLLDGIILVPLLFAGFQGFRNGLMREVIGLVGVVLSLFVSFRYLDETARAVSDVITISETYLPIVAFAVLFLSLLAGVQALIYLLEKILKMAMLSLPNRLLGLAFSVLKSSVFISAFLILLALFDMPGEELREGSMLYGYITPVAPVAYDALATVYPETENLAQTLEDLAGSRLK